MRSWPTYAGLTRDRHYGEGRGARHEFIVIDTGGFEPDSNSGIVKEMAKQTRQAVAEADAVIFVVDARAGLSAQDHDIARYLRSTGKRVLLAANKAEGMKEAVQLAEFYELGMGEPIPVSSAHGQGHAQPDRAGAGRGSKLPRTMRRAPALDDAGSPHPPGRGRAPERGQVHADQRLAGRRAPGGLRYAGHHARRHHVPFERGGQRFELIDTAGLRRKGKVFEAIEKFSVVKTLQAISDANVVLLLIDATQGVTDQDAHIAGYMLEAGRAVVIADQQVGCGRQLPARTAATLHRARLSFLKFAPVLHISAIKRQGLGPLWKAIDEAWASAKPQDAHAGADPPDCRRLCSSSNPSVPGSFRPKLRYAHQGGQNPPVIVIHGNSLEHVTDTYKRFLEGRFREHFKLTGTPLRIEMKSSSDNPFIDECAQ
jgi:GTP-binding protein